MHLNSDPRKVGACRSVILSRIAILLIVMMSPMIVFGEQDVAASTDVASWLMEKMNAGQYPEIQSKFSKSMKAAMPPEESDKFFTGMIQSNGKMLKLGSPQKEKNAVTFLTEFEKGAFNLKLSLNPAGQITALYFNPVKQNAPSGNPQQGPGVETYSKAVNELSGLINAGDYAAIDKKFSKEMREFMPLAESKKFFEGLVKNVGKIQKFGSPQKGEGSMVYPAEFERGNFDLEISVDNVGQITGVAFHPPKQPPQLNVELYSKVVKELGLLINAGDYAAIDKKFSKGMREFMPLAESTKYFGSLVKDAGKIQKFGVPQKGEGALVYPAEFERGNFDLEISIDNAGQITGLTFHPPKQPPQLNVELYSKVVKELGQLINAGDYAAIDKKLSKGMREIMPPAESAKYFGGLVKDAGKIQRFGAFQKGEGSMVYPTEFERGNFDLEISIDNAGQITGLVFHPPKQPPQLNVELYSKVVKELGQLINAGNYAAIDKKFSKGMKEIMPPAESAKYFGGLVKDAGKIQKFGAPQKGEGTLVYPTEFERRNFDLEISIDNGGLIAGLSFKPSDNSQSPPQAPRGGISDRDMQKADALARETASWFHYTTGRMNSEHLGQCSDYAVQFILKYNEYAGKNVARLVTTNNPVPSGTYRLGSKTDVAKLGFHGFPEGCSGFLILRGQNYIHHPVLGTYPIFLERAWTPKRHFGVNMLDKTQVHTWASVANVSVDPTWFGNSPEQFPSPLSLDE